jgi:hypothetical protein
MRSRPPHWFVLLVSALPSLGCSLMGLDDFGAAPCISDADCREAEAQLSPGPSACGAAVCEQETGLCKWQEHHEICNGDDDDCDGLIDEDLVLPAQVSHDATLEPAIVGYAVTSSERGQTFVAMVPDGGTAEGSTLAPSSPMKELRYDSALAPMNCPKGPEPVAQSDVPSCNFAEVALAADASHLVVASINTIGCTFGQLRVGLSELKEPFRVRVGKAEGAHTEQESNIAFGVDVDDQGCSGASRNTHTTGRSSRGATRPAVASLGTEANGRGALLVWLGTSARALDVPSDSIPVEALGLVVPAVKPEWLNGTNQGTPTVLGHSTSLSAPAVLALRGPGKYLVAFPGEQDGRRGIQLLTVPAARVSDFESLDFLAVEAADQVSLTLGNAERNEAGVAWRSGSGADAQVCFMVVSIASESPVPGLASSTSLRAQVCQSAGKGSMRSSSPPRLLFRHTGFATSAPHGGWFLSWVDDAQMFQVARAREESMDSLGLSSRPSTGIPLLYPSNENDWGIGYASVHTAGGTGQPETIPLWCE